MTVRATLAVVGVMIAQWWCNSHMGSWGFAPQLLLSLTILLAARRGPVTAMLLGYIWGLYSDLLRADLFGADAMLFAMAGYIAGLARKHVDLRAPGPLAASIFLFSWGYDLLLGLIGLVFLKSFIWVGWAAVLVTPFINAIAAGIASLVLDSWGHS